MTPHRIVLASAIAATLTLTACGKRASDTAAEAAVTAMTGGKVDVSKSGDQQQVTIKTDKGDMKINSGGEVALPKDFPSDVHLPGKYTIKSAMQMGPAFVLSMHSPDAVQAVFADYDKSMKAGGWNESAAMQTSDRESVLTFQKDKRNVAIVLTASHDAGGGSDVNVQTTSEQK
jgi:hypothetical protein